ncbi:MAG: hypothetical protein PHF84_00750 [bacterium]|nr:hypothetical protein [bacterium]
MKKYLPIFALLFLSFFLLNTSWKDIEQKFNEKSKQLADKYEKHSRMLDEKFSKTLSEKWFEAKFKEPEKLFDEPKPADVPVAPVEKPVVPDNTPVVVVAVPAAAAVPAVVPEPAPIREEEDEFKVTFGFFGTIVEIVVPQKVKSIKPVKMKNSAIAAYWQQVSSLNHKNTLTRLHEYQTNFLVNDWAYLMFVQRVSKELYPEDGNLQNLYTWFLLIKTGYQARIGYDNERVYLLLPCTTQLYSKTFFKFDNENFYRLSSMPDEGQMGSVFTYPGAYPEANKRLELKVKQWPFLKEDMKKRNLSFNYGKDKYNLSVQYNQALIDFVKDYPQTTVDAYTRAPLSDSSQANMKKKLAVLLKGKKETEAVDILLAFVQKAFSYKTDEEQFGREKWFFPEETLFYPYSDCEDRSVIFAQLVTDLLGLKVVMLHYPQHMATAVLFNGEVSGDKVKYDGKSYVVCDPTYVNASHGEAMPAFRKVSPEVVEF